MQAPFASELSECPRIDALSVVRGACELRQLSDRIGNSFFQQVFLEPVWAELPSNPRRFVTAEWCLDVEVSGTTVDGNATCS
ncbi:hypothetical protein D3C71_2080460 [compost metagenome]